MSIASSSGAYGSALPALTAVFTWVRTHLYTVAFVALLIGLAGPFLLKKQSEWDEVYLLAASHLRSGEQMYLLEDKYLYPPFMALLAIPFTFLPHFGSRAAWFGVNAACLIWLLRGTWQLSGGKRLEGAASDRSEHLACWLGLAVALRYGLDGFAHQQTDLAIAALLVAGCAALLRTRLSACRYLVRAGCRDEMHAPPLVPLPGMARPLASGRLARLRGRGRQPAS